MLRDKFDWNEDRTRDPTDNRILECAEKVNADHEDPNECDRRLSRRDQSFQLLVEVLDDDEARRGARLGTGRLEHQEPLTIGRHVIASERTASRKVAAALEQPGWRAGAPRAAARVDRNAHQGAVWR